MMRLETELRIRLQLMQLESAGADRPPSDCQIQCCDSDLAANSPIVPSFDPAPSTWVKLVQAIDLFSSEDALLLCPLSYDFWLAWIPDYGEAILAQQAFYLDCDEIA
jgi:hypothetical protein